MTGIEFSNKLVEQSEAEKPSPGKHIWELLPDDLRERMTRYQEGDDGESRSGCLMPLIGELNELFGRTDFYDEAAWSRYPLGEEGQQVAEAECVRTFGLGIAAAESAGLGCGVSVATLQPVQELATRVVYLGFEIWRPAAGRSRPKPKKLSRQSWRTFMSLLVGVIGVFVAILVTASIIPQMFEPGAIDLLLSRPLSRSLLFLSKFVGGCMFILLNSIYLIAGLWLYVGLRLTFGATSCCCASPYFCSCSRFIIRSRHSPAWFGKTPSCRW